MTKWDPRADEIFADALEIDDSAERAEFLDRLCGQETPLRAAVEELLASHAQAGSLLERPAAEVDHTMDVSRDAMEAGLAPAFGAETAVVVGTAGHSVLKSLSKNLPGVPHVSLRDRGESGGETVQPKPPASPRNDDDSRYQMLGEIARGGMGAVIKGRDTDLGRDLAIKVLLDSHKDKPEVVQRFVEEAQIGGQLQHPGIVPVYELGELNDERPFFSMKLVRGKTLAALLAARNHPSEDLPKLLGIFEQVCQTMAYAHSKGVIHRDLKPANIMVGAFGEVQVMDWGLSKVLREGGVTDEERSLEQDPRVKLETREGAGSDAPGGVGTRTLMGSVMGTLAYMPPEQALGKVDRLDERADVFGLGAILAEILTGAPPYVAEDSTDVFRLASRGSLDDCFNRLDGSRAEPELIEVNKKALAAEPDDRYRNAEELAERITMHLEGVQERLQAAEIARAKAQTRRKLSVAIAALMLLAALGASSAAVVFRSQREELKIAKQNAADERDHAVSAQKQAQAAEVKAATERDDAVIARNQATEQRMRAQIVQLAAQAQSVQDELPVQGVLLAMHAVDLAQESGQWPMPIAHETLLKTTADLGGVPVLHQADRVWEVPVSRNHRLVVASAKEGIRVLNLTADDPAGSALELVGAAGGRPTISPDGRVVVTNLSDGGVRVWGLSPSGDQVVSQTDLPLSDATSAISHNSRFVITYTQGYTRVWDLHAVDPAESALELGGGASKLHWCRIAMSPDNRWVCTAKKDTTRLWDLQAPDPAASVQEFPGTEEPSVAIGPNSRWLALGSEQGTRLFDLLADDIPASKRLLPGEGVNTVAFSSSGRWVAAGGREARLFELSASNPGPSAMVFRGHSGKEVSVGISPDDRWLVTCSGSECRIWDLTSIDRSELPVLEENDTSSHLWDVVSSSSIGLTRLLRGHEDSIWAMSITSDSRWLVTGGWDGNVRMWNLASENPATDTVLLGHSKAILSATISPDGHWVVTGGGDGTARLWDLTADAPSASSRVLRGPADPVALVGITSDSRWLVTACSRRPNKPLPTTTEARVWDLTADDPTKSPQILRGHEEAITTMAIGANNRYVVTGSMDRTARVWDLSALDKPRVLGGHDDVVSAVAMTSDCNFVFTGTHSGVVFRWDLTTQDPLVPQVVLETARVRKEQPDRIQAFSLGPNRPVAVTGQYLKPTRVWELDFDFASSPTVRALPFNRTDYHWHAIPISPDNRFVVARDDYTAQVWEILDSGPNRKAVRIHQHDGFVHGMAFSPDARWFATTSEDSTAQVSKIDEDTATAETLTLRGHEGNVMCAAISPDNRWVVTGDARGTARLWDLRIDTLMQRARDLVGRELTARERERYSVPPSESR